MEQKPKVKIEYDKELMELCVSIDNTGAKISVHDLEPIERILDLLEIPYEEKLGNMIDDMEYLQHQYENIAMYEIGVKIGIKKMMDKVERQFELGKPVLCNDNLYWMKDAKQNLIDIMDDIDSEHNKRGGKLMNETIRLCKFGASPKVIFSNARHCFRKLSFERIRNLGKAEKFINQWVQGRGDTEW